MKPETRTPVLSALFAILVGFAIVGMWAVSLSTDSMPELHATPWTARAHLAAEFLTAGMLLVSGVGLLARARWAASLHLVVLGMLLYAVVQASGYFVENGQPLMAGMFGLLALLALLDMRAIERLRTALPAPA